jgi:hypothetical protein
MDGLGLHEIRLDIPEILYIADIVPKTYIENVIQYHQTAQKERDTRYFKSYQRSEIRDRNAH